MYSHINNGILYHKPIGKEGFFWGGGGAGKYLY